MKRMGDVFVSHFLSYMHGGKNQPPPPAKKKNPKGFQQHPKKLQKITRKKSHAEFSNLKNLQKEWNDDEKQNH